MSSVAAIGRVRLHALAVAGLLLVLLAPIHADAAVRLPGPPLPASTQPGRADLTLRSSARPALGMRLPAMLRESVLDLQAPPAAPSPLASPPRPTYNVVGGVPFIWQVYSQSCEPAALQMTLAHQGIAATQDQILALVGADLRSAYRDGHGLRWGDPYATFVGDVDGAQEDLTGYGTYYPPIVRAAEALKAHVLRAGEGISPAVIYDALLDGHPAVLWIANDYAFHPRQDYTTFDGRRVLYAGPYEHAVTAVGVRGNSILIHDPLAGTIWVEKPEFEATYRTYNQMAVIFD
jgi:uncharacterized protein YvpB